MAFSLGFIFSFFEVVFFPHFNHFESEPVANLNRMKGKTMLFYVYRRCPCLRGPKNQEKGEETGVVTVQMCVVWRTSCLMCFKCVCLFHLFVDWTRTSNGSAQAYARKNLVTKRHTWNRHSLLGLTSKGKKSEEVHQIGLCVKGKASVCMCLRDDNNHNRGNRRAQHKES